MVEAVAADVLDNVGAAESEPASAIMHHDSPTGLAEAPSPYEALSREHLLALVMKKDGELLVCKQGIKALQKSRSYWKAKRERFEAQLVEQTAEHESFVRKVCFRPGTRNITAFGGYNVGLLRNSGHASAHSALAIVLGSDVAGEFHDQSIVTRFELRTAV